MSASATMERTARGGKRAQRARRAEPLHQAKRLLLQIGESHLGEEHDEDGAWGISPVGISLAEEAHKILNEASRGGNQAASPALRALDHMFDEMAHDESTHYFSDTAQGFLDDAIGSLG